MNASYTEALCSSIAAPSLQALEYSQGREKVPTCILLAGSPPGWGGLYHGGFKAIMNKEFLRKEKVTHIVNTARGLEIFGPKYLVSKPVG